MKKSFVYILKCADQSYYTGVTSDLENRLEKHTSGYYKSSYTYKRRPVKLVYYAEFTDINLAIEKEKQIKSWSRAKKEALITGNFNALVKLAKKNFE